MDINNNSNISNIVSSSISKLNLNTASRALKQAEKELENTPEAISEDFKQEDISLIENPKTKGVDVDEIQKYANYMGENLSIDDINYGLMYGRSVIIDYSA